MVVNNHPLPCRTAVRKTKESTAVKMMKMMIQRNWKKRTLKMRMRTCAYLAWMGKRRYN